MGKRMAEALPDEIATLVTRLGDPVAATRLDAAERLCRAGEAAASAAIALVKACGDDEPEVRDWAVAALEELGPPPDGTTPELQALIDRGEPLVAYWAITLLGRSGQAAATAVNTLTGCLTSASDPAVAQRAAWALGKIGSAAAAPALRDASQSADPRLARLASEALAAIET